MAHEASLLREAAAVLERVRLMEARGSLAETAGEQIEILLARAAGLTAALRQHAGDLRDAGAERLIVRLLLNDLAMVAADLRSGANDVRERLDAAAASAGESLDRAAAISEP